MVTDRSLGRVLGILGVAFEAPLVGQLFFWGDVFGWGLLFTLALLGPALALGAVALSAAGRDRLGLMLGIVGLGGILVPVVLVWAVFAAFQQG